MPDLPPSPATSDLIRVASFIGWHDPGYVMGGVKASEAFEAFATLLRLPPARLLHIIRNENLDEWR